MKKPAVPLILNDFEKQEKEVSLNLGMPGLRIQYFRGPVWGKTNEQLKKQIVEGNNPITGKPVMPELVEKLTKPLTAEEQKTGEVKQDLGPKTYTGTPDELQKLFLEKRYTDFLPVVLPTEDKVAEMLKFTSHQPTEVLGKMNPGSEAGETWTYTVKDAAVNAVMAGAQPEYFPVILALGSTGMTAVNVSDNGFMAGAVINGKIRDEIGLNYEEGAVGPYAQANTTIGRAWSLLSINGGNCGKVGTTYMGTIGNPMNLIGIIIAENEEKSPFKPLAVRRGFKEGENIVTLFMGWGILSAKNWAATVWGPNMNYPEIIKEIYNTQDGHLVWNLRRSESADRQFRQGCRIRYRGKVYGMGNGSEAWSQARSAAGGDQQRRSQGRRDVYRHRHRRIQQQLLQYGRHGALPVSPD